VRTALFALLASVAPTLVGAQAVQILHELDAPGPSLTFASGFLYGVTPTGEVYRVSPGTGLVSMTGSVHGAFPSPPVAISRLVADASGDRLYGVTRDGPGAMIFAVDPISGQPGPVAAAPIGLRGLTLLGSLFYGFVDRPGGVDLVSFTPPTGSVTPVMTVFHGDTAVGGPGELVAAADGLLYYAMVPDRTPELRQPHLVRLSLANRTIEELPMPPAPTGSDYADLRATSDGRVLVHVSTPSFPLRPLTDRPSGPSTSRIDAFDVAAGTERTLCHFGYTSAEVTPPVIDDSLLVVLSNHLGPAVRRCDPVTGAVSSWPLLAEIHSAPRLTQAPDGLFYGVASGRLGGAIVYRLAVQGMPPDIDTDGDGLDNTWETQYALSPTRSIGDDGAAGDPDHDGRTNAEERAAGTHPRGMAHAYLAEGATGAFFSTRISMLNPSSVEPARVLMRFFTDTGAVVTHSMWLSPLQPYTIDLGDVPGLASANVSTLVEADRHIVVDRTMRWGAGGYGSHAEAAVPAPSSSWFLAEGSTSGDFALFYLLLNPQDVAVTVTVRYLRPFSQPVVERTYVLPAASRTTIAVDGEGPELANTDVSAAVTATAPIIVERAMYLTRGGQPFAAGHASAGVTAPALEWILAEGATGPFFDMFILIANPNPAPATIAVDYLMLGGGALSKTYTVAANSRQTIWVDEEELPVGSGRKPLADAALSARVRSTNQVPVVVERTMWWPGPALTADFWYEAHNSPGATALHTLWAFAGAEVGPGGLETYVLIANPSSREGEISVTARFLDGTVESHDYPLRPNSRSNVALGADFRSASGHGPFGVVVQSWGIPTRPPDKPQNPGVPIAVEYSTYSSPGNVTWASGSNALATPVP